MTHALVPAQTMQGGCDEYMRFFLFKKTWPKADIDSLIGRLAGNADEDEMIAVGVIPFAEMFKVHNHDAMLSSQHSVILAGS